MKNKYRIGQIAIRPGTENSEPEVVYVLGKNGFDSLALQVLNSGRLSMASPEKDTLIPFDFEKYEIMRAEWFVNNHKAAMDRWSKERDELIARHSAK